MKFIKIEDYCNTDNIPLSPGDTVSFPGSKEFVVVSDRLRGYTLMNIMTHELHSSCFYSESFTIDFIRKHFDSEAVCKSLSGKTLKVGDRISFLNCSSAGIYTLIYDTYCYEWRILSGNNRIYYGRYKSHEEHGLDLSAVKRWFKDKPNIYVVTE